MFINFWYPAEQASALGQKPVRVRMLGQNFVLFRDSAGVAHCLSNVCLHRCGSLGDGWVRNDRVVCPYHGWEFNGSGQCERIPSLGRRESRNWVFDTVPLVAPDQTLAGD